MKYILLSMLFFYGIIQAGVPTIDTAQIAKMQEQIATMERQFQEKYAQMAAYILKFNEFKSRLEGITQHAQMLQDKIKEMHSLAPDNLNDVRGILRKGSGLENMANSLMNKFQAITPANAYGGNQETNQIKRALYKRRGDIIFGNMALVTKALGSIKARKTSLEGLTKSITTASTQKSVLDIQARIAAENSLLLNDVVEALYTKMNLDLMLENNKRNEISNKYQLGDGLKLR